MKNLIHLMMAFQNFTTKTAKRQEGIREEVKVGYIRHSKDKEYEKLTKDIFYEIMISIENNTFYQFWRINKDLWLQNI